MTMTQTALLATYALYGAMAVLAVSMLAFAVHTGRLASARSRVREDDRSRVLVGAGAARRGADVQDVVHPHDADAGTATSSETDGPVFDPARDRAGSLGMSLGWLAALLAVTSMALRGLAVSRVPVANLFEFAVAGGTATLLTYLVLAQRRPLRWLGLFVTLPVLSVLGLALVAWYVPAAELAPALQSYWIAIHVPIAIISIGIFTVAFCILVVQLLQERRERSTRGDEPRTGLLAALPDSARLDRTAYSLHVVAFPLWTFTIIAGAIWGQKAWGTYWSWDPKEVWSFVIWVLYAAHLHARATSGWKRRTSNLIAAAGYVGIILNTTVVNFYSSGLHSYSGL